MATIDIGVRVNLEESSLRGLQQQLTNAVTAINPKLNVDINEDGLKRFLRNAQNITLKIGKIEGQKELTRAINELLQNKVVKLAGFNRGDLTRLRRELQEEISRVEVSTQRIAGARGAVSSAEAGLGAVTSGTDVSGAREELVRLENQISSGRENIQRILQEVIQLEEAQRDFAKKTTEVQGRNLRLIEQRRVQEFLQLESELKSTIKREKDARLKLVKLSENRAKENFLEDENKLKKAIRAEVNF